MEIRPRESVIFAESFQLLVEWYQKVLQFRIVQQFEDQYHYCNLENETGIRIGIGTAKEMRIIPGDRANNTVLLQFQTDDVKSFLDHVKEHGGNVTFGPSFDQKDEFWFGGFQDLEGNPIWVVDGNCPS